MTCPPGVLRPQRALASGPGRDGNMSCPQGVSAAGLAYHYTARQDMMLDCEHFSQTDVVVSL